MSATTHPGGRDLDRAIAELADDLPGPLSALANVAYNYQWSWTPGGDELFASMDPQRWRRCGGNPVQFIREMGRQRLDQLAADAGFATRLDELVARVDLRRPVERSVAAGLDLDEDHPIAFLCSEYAVHASLPIYSGGLGALAGDILKEASDLGLDMVGVGLMYRSGYFHQRIDTSGWQHEYWTDTNPENLPAVIVTDDCGAPLRFSVPIDDEDVVGQVWRVDVGRVPLYLLDTDLPENGPVGRWITSRLYEGNRSIRLAQYAVLGVGGVRALRAMGVDPAVYHLNEGHAALCAFERFAEARRSGLDHDAAWQRVRSATVFTTHTPVAAGNETYSAEEILSVLGSLATSSGIDDEEFLARGRIHPEDRSEPSGMTPLAIRSARSVNGVSRRHGEVARSMWQPLFAPTPTEEVPISHVTNGVHAPSWICPPMRGLLDRHLGAEWPARASDPATWEPVARIPDDELWAARTRARTDMIDWVRERAINDRLRRGEGLGYAEAVERTLDPDVLTVGFARRLATYKRLHLVIADAERAIRLLSGDRPIQFLFAGRAHPQDDEAKRIVQTMFSLKGADGVAGRVAFLEDYDLTVARWLVAGCDVWGNLPRPPLEASGTSGMKAGLNGVLNVSVLDGWWPEAYDGTNGWAISGEVDADTAAQDRRHTSALFDLLEREVVPWFHERDADGLPNRWLAMVRRSLQTIGPRFCATRMVNDYVTGIYPPRL
ncbi:MAG: alpha-glucan family phosphorylase [Microthrixaceae bacterium]|nr:alpha-glucan family phosphorylase [Microthrixaceae bacterium]